MTPLTPLHPWIAAKIGCPAGELTQEAIAAYQLWKLQETLDWSRARSPAYRQRLAGYPATISSLSDWRAFPFTTANDLRERPLSFLCTSQSDIARVVTLDTSGTSGPPKRLYFTAQDQELTRDFFQVGMSTFTAPGERVLIMLPCDRPGSVGDLLDEALRRFGAEGIRHGLVRDVGHTLAVIQETRATAAVGVPVQALSLVRAAAARESARPRLNSVLLTTDHVPEAVARAVEQAWGCTVYNHYGMTEMGLGGGVECGARQGYHLREADLYFEVVDPQTGEALPDGELGEIVFTTLTRRGMPLIRYRTGDISRFLPGPCACGTVLRRLEKVCYRLAGRHFLTPTHALTMADLDDALFPLEGVLDFAPALSGDTLRVTVWAEAEGLEPAVRHALSNVPAIRAAGLRVDVAVQREAMVYAGKRRF